MVVVEDDGPKDLYVDKDFASLKKRAQADETKMSLNSKYGYIKILDNMNVRIEEAYLKKDQEFEYIMLFRFIQVCTKMVNTPDQKNTKVNLKTYRNYANRHMDRLEQLENLLKMRYDALTAQSSLREADQSTNLYSNMFSAAHENKVAVSTHLPHLEIPGIREGFINSENLYSLLENHAKKKTSLLIIDCRTTHDFKNSHIKYDDLINVPQASCCRGTSAALLQCSIVKESRSMWEKRHSYDMVLLVDRDSTIAKMKGSPLLHINILHEILTKWDIKGRYRCLVVLDGGFEEFEIRYPHYTTNPNQKFSGPTCTQKPDPLKYFTYPEVPEMVPKKPPEQPKPQVPAFNRLMKPKAGFTALKQFQEEEKVKEQNQDEKGQERGDSAIASGSPTVPGVPIETEPAELEMSVVSDGISPNPAEATLFPDPLINDSSSSEGEGGHREEEVPTDNRMSSDQQAAYVSNLRKVKPKASEAHIPASPVLDYSSDSSEENERIPLKKDGTGSGMKRSLSSPNIAKIKDDDMMPTPAFSRSNKPKLTPRTQPTVSLLLGENPDAVYGKTQLGLTGLKNFANNCYMNSIVQCLSNTAPLVQELTNFNKKPPVNSSSATKGQVASVFVTALHCIWSGDVKVYSIRELKNLMGNFKEIFKGSNHQDSHEFLIILLEYLHDDLNIPRELTVLSGANEESGERAWGEFRKKNESVVQRLFYGQEQSSVTCTVCNHRSVTFDHFFNLSVPIPDRTDRTTLEECIQVYLSGESIMWTCPKCKVDRKAVKKLDITRLPPILIIALKRFSHEVSWLEKKETLVTYPLESLEMRHHTLPGSEQRHTVYNLHALSTHTGTLRAGHYRAICQNHLTNKWYLFDDTSIHSISAQDVRNNPEVYILFYHAVK